MVTSPLLHTKRALAPRTPGKFSNLLGGVVVGVVVVVVVGVSFKYTQGKVVSG
jgi:hypothetical protein